MRNFFLFACCLLFMSCKSQPGFGQELLKLEKEIALPGVKGRIDHIDINVKDQIAYVAALGNNTVEVVDLKKGVVSHNITGLSEPQGVAYIPKHHELFVANGGTGECIFYNAVTYQKTGFVKYDDDADDVRYDEASDRVYVGYGSGGIGIIDAATHKPVADIKLPAHPESFQLDTKEGKLWVNLPGSGSIGVVDIKQGKLVDQWKRLLPRSNFPMAYDAFGHRVMVGFRIPATLRVLDSRTGKELFSSSLVGDVDDFYWDENTKQILISGGGGSVNLFKQTGDTYKQVADIKTRSGARTSLFVPELRLFLLAARENNNQPASLMVYRLAD
jgi:DNA-binding beta-propeller fold protein YncE